MLYIKQVPVIMSDDLQSLQERIQNLLSLSPTQIKKDKFASTNIVNPVGDVKRKLKNGFYDGKCKLHLGQHDTPGFSYYHTYFNLDDVDKSDRVLHLYGNPSVAALPDISYDALIVVHSHDRDQYCPWRSGCHVWLDRDSCRVHESRLPEWFKTMWKDLYEWTN